MSDKKLFRVSFSVLKTVSADIDNAIMGFCKMYKDSEAMKDGREFHDMWENYVNCFRMLPPEFSYKKNKLRNPITEKKIELEIDNWINFVGVPDLVDGKNIYEYKTGKTPINNDYIMQVHCYSLFYPKTKQGIILHYNQHNFENESAVVKFTDKTREYAMNWIQDRATTLFVSLQFAVKREFDVETGSFLENLKLFEDLKAYYHTIKEA